MKDRLFKYIKSIYKASPEYLWRSYPEYAVFRHSDNKKWFGIVMNVSRDKLGQRGSERVYVLNVKISDPLLMDMLLQQTGHFRGYHMNKTSWLSVLLDGTVPFEDICGLLAESYAATASKEKKQKNRPPKEWLIPANPKYYDIEAAFAQSEEIDWKQGAGIKKGDTVYIYMAAPVSAILYKCLVTDTDKPYQYDDGNVHMKALMMIKLQKRYKPERFTFERLKRDFGIYAVRGPRGVPYSLSQELK